MNYRGYKRWVDDAEMSARLYLSKIKEAYDFAVNTFLGEDNE